MVRRQFKEQVQVVADGGDPIGVRFDGSEAPLALIAGNYILDSKTDLTQIPLLSLKSVS